MEINDFKDGFISANEKIRSAKNILLATHERPDGDGLSSVCALTLFLDSLGKKYSCFCADLPSDSFSFLPNINKFSTETNFNFQAFDLIIIIDCGSLSRTKLEEKISQKTSAQTIIEFDHHPKVDDYADLEIRIPAKSSAAEVLYLFFSINNITITPPIANCLLTGIMTDTGNLLFSSVTEKTVEIYSKLLLAGGSLPKTIRQTSNNKGLAALKVWGRILNNLQLNEKYNFAYSVMTLEEVQSFKLKFGGDHVFDAASDILNNVNDVKAVLFLREEAPGKIRGSLRTKYPGVDISRLAKILGGGGHPKAAAFRLDGHIIKTETGGWEIK